MPLLFHDYGIMSLNGFFSSNADEKAENSFNQYITIDIDTVTQLRTSALLLYAYEFTCNTTRSSTSVYSMQFVQQTSSWEPPGNHIEIKESLGIKGSPAMDAPLAQPRHYWIKDTTWKTTKHCSWSWQPSALEIN